MSKVNRSLKFVVVFVALGASASGSIGASNGVFCSLAWGAFGGAAVGSVSSVVVHAAAYRELQRRLSKLKSKVYDKCISNDQYVQDRDDLRTWFGSVIPYLYASGLTLGALMGMFCGGGACVIV